jgi:hypothetical protein
MRTKIRNCVPPDYYSLEEFRTILFDIYRKLKGTVGMVGINNRAFRGDEKNKDDSYREEITGLWVKFASSPDN